MTQQDDTKKQKLSKSEEQKAKAKKAVLGVLTWADVHACVCSQKHKDTVEQLSSGRQHLLFNDRF